MILFVLLIKCIKFRGEWTTSSSSIWWVADTFWWHSSVIEWRYLPLNEVMVEFITFTDTCSIKSTKVKGLYSLPILLVILRKKHSSFLSLNLPFQSLKSDDKKRFRSFSPKFNTFYRRRTISYIWSLLYWGNQSSTDMTVTFPCLIWQVRMTIQDNLDLISRKWGPFLVSFILYQLQINS